MTDTPQTTEQRLDEIAARAADDPFYVSDCEGSLQVWREKALTHVRRDESGEIDMYSFPSTYKVTDQIIELDLSTWDLGEDATDDQQRQDITDLVESRAALPALLDTIRRHRDRADEAESAIAAVRALHVPDENGECQGCGASFDPCPTIAALGEQTTEGLAAADNPTHLRWDLGDVLHGDDGTVIVMMSGLDRQPYWLELDPPQAAVLREDLAGPATTHPASHCPRAAHTLQWGLHPDSTTQGWILRHQHDDGSSSVGAVLDGYPHGRTPVLAGEAQGWADRILGAPQGLWVEQPARSGAYHRHNTALPGKEDDRG